MSFALRQAVIYQGRKWLVTAVPDALQRHGLYNLARPDASGRIGKHSETRVNVHARELQREVDLCA